MGFAGSGLLQRVISQRPQAGLRCLPQSAHVNSWYSPPAVFARRSKVSMQNGVFLAITMPVADAYGDICAQNDSSPILCEAPEDRGVGYFYFIFRCSCLQGFNPHPMVIGKLHANLV